MFGCSCLSVDSMCVCVCVCYPPTHLSGKWNGGWEARFMGVMGAFYWALGLGVLIVYLQWNERKPCVLNETCSLLPTVMVVSVSHVPSALSVNTMAVLELSGRSYLHHHHHHHYRHR